jgi:opacity protein-like surface antigen
MMQSLRAASIAALLAAPLAALAAQPGLYVGGHVGANNLSDWPASVDFGAGVSAPGSLSLDSGAHFGILGGRQTENARFEVEYQRGRFELNGLELGGLTQAASGSGHYDALTFNAYRTFALADRWAAFAGLGIGWGKAVLPGASFGPCNCFPASSKSGFAYQARVGAEYELAPSHLIFAQASWLRLPSLSSGGSPGVSYARHSVTSLGIGYRKTF